MQSNYRPDIDGLRALAVVPVVLFHAGLGFPGGYVGVDIFFVISGYLITAGLLKDNARGIFSIARFYERRIRRIVPALAVVTLATLVAGAFVLLPSEYERLGASAVSAALFYSNIHFWSVQNYFDGGNITHPLLHSWSLSVEEQFYIVWPIAIWAIYRLRLSRWLPALMIAAIAATLAASEWMLDYSPKTAFYMSPLRAWELLLGALLATGRVPPVRRAALAQGLSLAALAMIGWSIFALTEASRFPGLAAVPSCLGAAILIHLGGPERSIGNRLLSLRPLVWIGLLSYSLYLWHWPNLSLFTVHKGSAVDPVEGAALALISLVLAWLSLRFVEQPFRKPPGTPHRRGGRDWPVLAAGGATLAGVAACGVLLMVTGGFPGRVNAEARAIDAHRREKVTVATGCIVGDDLPGDLMDRCFSAPAARDARIAVWGDSFARQYANELASRYKDRSVEPLMLMATGCAPLAGVRPTFGHGRADLRCEDFNQFALRSLLAIPDLEQVIIAGRWSNLYGLPLPGGELVRTARFYTATDASERSLGHSLALMEQSLDRAVSALEAKGVRVTLIAEPPRYPESVQRCAARAAWDGADPAGECSTSVLVQRRFRKPVMDVLQSIASRHPQTRLYDPLTRFCGADGLCRGYRDGILLTEDVDHLSRQGSIRALDGLDLPMPRAAAGKGPQ